MSLYGGPEWRAHLVEDFPADATRVFIVRDAGDRLEFIRRWDEYGAPEVHHLDRAVSFPDDARGLLVPNSALQSIAARLRPNASGPEVKRLEEALAVERARTDQTLTRLLRIADEAQAAPLPRPRPEPRRNPSDPR